MAEKRVRLLSNAAIVGSATMASRVTGFIRDIFIAALLGAGPLAEIFVIAFRLPNLFRRLFAEGAFNAAFVPLFTQKLNGEERAAALAFAAQVFAVLLAALGVFTLLAQIFMPGLVLALAQGFAGDAEKFDAAVYYARITFPYLIAMSLVSLFAAMLNATGRFFAAAFAPILLNLVLIGAMGAAMATRGAPLDYLIWGVALAGLAQFGFVFIAAYRAGLRIKLARPRLTPQVKNVWWLAVPGILAAGIGQINLLVGTSIATGQAGAAAWLYYADRLYQLPMGVIGVALSVALLPALARHLAQAKTDAARDTQSMAVLAAGLLTFPAAAGLFALAEPIIGVLFERGAFGAKDTAVTALVLRGFCLGLPAFVFIKALQPSFFARQDTRAPLVDGAIGVGVNITLSLMFFDTYGALAIALATSVAGYVTLALMLVRLAARDIWQLRGALVWRLAGQIAAALGMMGALIYMPQFYRAPTGPDLAVWLAVMIAGGAVIFCLLAIGFGALRRSDVARLRGRA
jgi:putative peptidoglycan lipid II flippase